MWLFLVVFGVFLTDHFVEEQVPGYDGIAFHPHHFGDLGECAVAVAQPGA